MKVNELKVGDRIKFYWKSTSPKKIWEGIIMYINENGNYQVKDVSAVWIERKDIISKLEPVTKEWGIGDTVKVLWSDGIYRNGKVFDLKDYHTRNKDNCLVLFNGEMWSRSVSIKALESTSPVYKEIPIEKEEFYQFCARCLQAKSDPFYGEVDTYYLCEPCKKTMKAEWGYLARDISTPVTTVHCPVCDKQLWGTCGVPKKEYAKEPCKECKTKAEKQKTFKFEMELVKEIEFNQFPLAPGFNPECYFRIKAARVLNHDLKAMEKLNGKKISIEIKEI